MKSHLQIVPSIWTIGSDLKLEILNPEPNTLDARNPVGYTHLQRHKDPHLYQPQSKSLNLKPLKPQSTPKPSILESETLNPQKPKPHILNPGASGTRDTKRHSSREHNEGGSQHPLKFGFTGLRCRTLGLRIIGLWVSGILVLGWESGGTPSN